MSVRTLADILAGRRRVAVYRRTSTGTRLVVTGTIRAALRGRTVVAGEDGRTHHIPTHPSYVIERGR
jgi:hypothetical protein